MAKSLQEFVSEEHKRLDRFEKHWLTQHELTKNTEPKNYPLVMEEGNDGLWHEMLMDFE